MQCKYCGAEINVLDSTCRECGKSLSILKVEPESGGFDLFADVASKEIEQELASAQRELLGDGLAVGVEMETSGFEGDPVQWRLGELATPAGRHFVDTNAGMPSVETGGDEIQQITQFVFYSAHIQANPLYKKRADSTTLVFQAGDDIVNAFATDSRMGGISAEPPMIVLFGGMARAIKLASLALGVDRTVNSADSRKQFVRAMRAIGESIVANMGQFSSE